MKYGRLKYPDLPKFIYEIGTLSLYNKDLTFRWCQRAIIQGADYVKLQIINPETAFWATPNQLKRYKSIAWSLKEWYEFLQMANYRLKNRVFASVFDPAYVKPLRDVMPIWKVAYRMRENTELIQAMLDTDKPVIFSTNDKFYSVDKKTWFDKYPKQFIRLYVTPYDYREVDIDSALHNKVFNEYDGFSLNFGGRQGVKFIHKLAPKSEYVELHTKGWRPIGPDMVWSYGFEAAGVIKDDILGIVSNRECGL